MTGFLGCHAGMQLGITFKDIQQQTVLKGRLSHSLPPSHMALLISLQQQEQLSDLMAGHLKEPRGRKKKTSTKLPAFCQNYPEFP